MLKSLQDFSMMDLLPDSLTRDPQIRAYIEGIDEELRKLSKDIRETLILSRIDELPENVLDLLAWQFHLDFYQPAELDIGTKRELIRESIADHRIRGTPAAVEKLLTTIFNNASVKEWWEFDGAPYTFRIEQLGKTLATEQDYKDFELALDVAKNVRSHLESFTVRIVHMLEMFHAFIKIQSKIKRKKYDLELKPSQMTSSIGFIGVKSLYRVDKPRIGAYIPPLQEYIGFLNEKRISRKFFAIESDLPVHDLRSTSILDLLILGLGILRESNLESKPIWAYADHLMQNFIGIIQSRDISIKPSNRISLKSTLNSRVAMIRSETLRQTIRPSLRFYNTLNLHCYLFAAKIVSRFFGANPEIPIDATISKFLDLRTFIGFSQMKSVVKKNSTSIDLNSNISNFIGLINLRSILKHKSLDVIEKTPVLYRRNDQLNLFAGFAKFFSGSIRRQNYPRQFFNINIDVSMANLKSIKKSKFHRIDPVDGKSRVYIGAIFHRFGWRKFSPIQEERIYRKRHELPIYSAFARFNSIQRSIRDLNRSNDSKIEFTVANINLKSLIRKNLRHDSTSIDSNVYRDSILQTYLGFAKFNSISKIQRDKLKFELISRNSIGTINFKSIWKIAVSNDSPSMKDEFVEKISVLNSYVGICDFKSISRKFSSNIQNPPNISLNFATINIRNLNRMNAISKQFARVDLNEYIGLVSVKTISRKIVSDYRIDWRLNPAPSLNLFAGFAKIQALNRKYPASICIPRHTNINVAFCRIVSIRHENRQVAIRLFNDQPIRKSKMVIYFK